MITYDKNDRLGHHEITCCLLLKIMQMYGLYGLRRHILEKSGDVTNAGR